MKTCYNHFRMLLQWVVHPAACKGGRSGEPGKKKHLKENMLQGFSPDHMNMRGGKSTASYTRNPPAP